MAQFFRDGLVEALLDFGVDVRGGGLDVPLDVPLTIQISDISLNYMPAIRCRASLRLALPLGGAATYNGISIQAPGTGMWLNAVQNAEASGVLIWWSTTRHQTTSHNVAVWMAIGDEAGQIRTSNLTDFFGPDGTYYGASATAPGGATQTAGFLVLGFLPSPNCPIWTPANSWLNLTNVVPNSLADISIDLQFAAQNPGRLP